MPIILAQQIIKESQYDDIPYVRYHFPKQYLSQISTGDLFIYHQGDSRNNKHRFYFGMGVIGRITAADDGEHYYAEIVDGKSFAIRVPIYHVDEKYYELIENDGIPKKKSPAWQRSIRQISEKAYEAILEAAGIGPEAKILSSIADVEKGGDSLNTLSILNEKYKDLLPEEKNKIITRHLDRGKSITDSLKSILGAKCQVCEMEGFEKCGGGRYIEAHHLNSIAAKTPSALCTDNIILVCPNCHREIHYGKDVRIDDLGDTVNIKIGANKEAEIKKNSIIYLRSLIDKKSS